MGKEVWMEDTHLILGTYQLNTLIDPKQLRLSMMVDNGDPLVASSGNPGSAIPKDAQVK